MASPQKEISRARDRMVDRQIAARGVRDGRVLAAMRHVPRDAFVEEGSQEFAYEDSPLPIGEGQTISQPYIVAFMLEAAEISPGDRVLEIGAGFRYAAAVSAQLAAEVCAVERHASLVAQAQYQFDRLGYRNISLRHADGDEGLAGWRRIRRHHSFGWRLANSSGSEIPVEDRRPTCHPGRRGGRAARTPQIDTPLGEGIRRGTAGIGSFRAAAWRGSMGGGWATIVARPICRGVSQRRMPAGLIAEAVEPLPDFNDPCFGALFDRFAGKRVMLLGEASHGTSEFYRARAAITRHLIAHHGFSIVAVEADWPDAAAVDRYVRHLSRRETEAPFQRFPTWMWRNTDVDAFIHAMRDHNATLDEKERAGFYELDIYNMAASIASVLEYLDKVDPRAAAVARECYGCLTPRQREPSTYGRAVLTEGYRKCEEAVVAQLRDLLGGRLRYEEENPNSFLDAAQNARLVASAERYYRIMYYGDADLWNLRDTHMFETLEHVLDGRGAVAKAVVWAHNSHIGDARRPRWGLCEASSTLGNCAASGSAQSPSH